MVEHLLAKEKVAGSNPVFRSKKFRMGGPEGPFVVSGGCVGGATTLRCRAGVAERQTLRS